MTKHLPNLISVLLFSCSITLGQGKMDFAKVKGTSIDIYIPPEYSEDNKYPVVYFNDGQMLFGHSTISMALQLTLDSLIKNKRISPLLVVGIPADRLRKEKYVPYMGEDFELRADGGSYFEFYADHLAKDIVSYVDANFSTIKDASGRAVFGFSFGGLNALWMTLNYPKVFSMGAGFSASFWVNDFALFDEASRYQPEQKIWFDVGTAEWNYNVPFQKMLKDQGARINRDVFYSEVPGGLHAMKDWKERIEMPFLIFAGTEDHVAHKMDVEIEIIPSQSVPGKKFTRVNPIVTCKSGLVYSLAYEAQYQVTNPTAGKVYEDGSFELFGEEPLEVLVTYRDLSKKVKIRPKLLDD